MTTSGGELMERESIRSRPFPVPEYLERLARVQEAMARSDLSALVVADPANLYYLTGYNAWSFYMPQCLVVPVRGEPHLFMREMDAQGAHYTAYLPVEQIHGYPEDLVHRPDRHPFDWIGRQAVELGVLEDTPSARVGVETDAPYFSVRSHLALRAQLASAELVDSHELVNWVRVVKSPLEQDKLRVAGEIAQNVMRIALEHVEPGRRQCDVVAQIQYAQALGARKLGGDYPAIVPMLPTGETAGTPHLTWSDLPLRPGEATTVELAGVYHRYHVPLARTVSLGPPPAELRRCADAVTEGLRAALEELRPGSTGHRVQAAFADAVGRHGYVKGSRVGYSIGVGYPPDWGERTISLRSGDLTRLQRGMAFHVILGMWMEGWGYELSEPVLVGTGPDGAVERLAPLPQDLVVKD
ncbi:M24 family metallopeptidase [Ornithinimicrobium pekingense]|uniref:Xaa-Pro aminopeptidase n=1 Tax=Ornithinimicrobium pekingense TaxID=384677 RepID=A0ABQ2F9R2_9MICO|nr:M24 family metallopeptidase [Ornithinimicrobium pekingense]GGK72426.1 Xaa-Pro aminopeptidase [Ornithinimicrobium pekingense]